MCFSGFGVKEIIEIWWETPWKITSELWKPHSALFWDTKEKIGVQCPSDQEHNPEYILFSTAWLLIPPGLRSAHNSPRYICQDSSRQWSMHKSKSWEANAALLLQGLCMCPNHKASDSCFIFADLMVLLPVCYLHHTDGGYSSLISSPTRLHLPASPPLNTPRLEVRAPSWEEEPQLRNASEARFSVPEYSAKPTTFLSSYVSARGLSASSERPSASSSCPSSSPMSIQHPGSPQKQRSGTTGTGLSAGFVLATAAAQSCFPKGAPLATPTAQDAEASNAWGLDEGWDCTFPVLLQTILGAHQ